MRQFLRFMPHPFFIAVALVTVLSLIPAASIPQAVQFWDKAQHALAYTVLAITGSLAFPRQLKLILLGLLAHGALIEIMQSTLTTTRLGEVLDWFADGTGVLAGISIFSFLLARPVNRLQAGP